VRPCQLVRLWELGIGSWEFSPVYWSFVGAWLSLVERSVRDREVAGSNPVAPTTSHRSIPGTWVTLHSGHAGNFFGRLTANCSFLRLTRHRFLGEQFFDYSRRPQRFSRRASDAHLTNWGRRCSAQRFCRTDSSASSSARGPYPCRWCWWTRSADTAESACSPCVSKRAVGAKRTWAPSRGAFQLHG
jgi:hypothetical protein